MNIKKLIIAILFITAVIVIPKPSTSVDDAIEEVDDTIEEVDIEMTKEFKKIVTLTTYTIDPSQTDDEPLITASGFKVDSINPRKHRIIAISRDLKKTLGFGDKVRLENAGRFNGVWHVRDVMNKRFKNKIDILINPNGTHTKLYDVVITKLD